MYVYNNVTGRIAAIFLQGTPLPPSGFTATSDPIDNEQIIDSKRNIGTGDIQKRDALKVTGSNSMSTTVVGQLAVQKYDGETLADKTAPSDNDPVSFKIENEAVFLDADSKNLVQGAASVKVAAPQVAAENRFLAHSPELQLLDAVVVFT